MEIFLDLETCPAQDPAVRADIRANIKAPATYKKPESIAEWLAENAEAEAEAAWRKTSFDGGTGHICVIGFAVDDGDPQALHSPNWHASEAAILAEFYHQVNAICAKRPNERPVFIGHNLIEFDLRFLFQRSVVLGVKPSHHIPFSAKPWDDKVFDTMTRWDAKNRTSMDKLCRALGFDGKGDINGAMVWDFVRDGRIAEVAEYCKGDITRTRQLYRRMTFQDLQAA